MLVRTNHSGFTVSDLDRTVAFYTDVLGFELIARGPRDIGVLERITGVPGAELEVAYLHRPEHTVELMQYCKPDQRGRLEGRPCDTGFALMAFDVSDIEGMVFRCRAHGVSPISPPVTNTAGPNAGAKIVYLRDADGLTFEFIERPPTA